MCYYTALNTDEAAFQLRYHRLMLQEPRSRFPYQFTKAVSRPWWPVITTEEPSLVAWKQWGLLPTWVEDPEAFLERNVSLNAVCEEVPESPIFKDALANGRRCLIPVTAFYEWKMNAVEGEGTQNQYPYKITLRDEPLFSLAGLYEGDTFTVLTRPSDTFIPRKDLSQKRKPVIIPRAFEGDWLNPRLNQSDVMRFCRAVEKKDLVAEEYNDEIGPLSTTG